MEHNVFVPHRSNRLAFELGFFLHLMSQFPKFLLFLSKVWYLLRFKPRFDVQNEGWVFEKGRSQPGYRAGEGNRTESAGPLVDRRENNIILV